MATATVLDRLQHENVKRTRILFDGNLGALPSSTVHTAVQEGDG
jgi:hypothetical protein